MEYDMRKPIEKNFWIFVILTTKQRSHEIFIVIILHHMRALKTHNIICVLD